MEQTLKIETYYPTLPAMQKKYDKLARKDRFTGTTQADFAQWRAEARARLRDLLGMDCMEPCDLQPQLLERTDLPGGSYKALLQSIKTKLLTLPDDVHLLPGHGPSTSVAWEKRRNPFLQ